MPGKDMLEDYQTQKSEKGGIIQNMKRAAKIQLSDNFNYGRLLRFTFPTIVMMIFTSIYGVVDGIFVSNFVGKTPFAAVNLIMPVLMIFGSVGFMVGTGGSAIVAVRLGEGKREEANGIFSLLIYFTVFAGLFLMSVGLIFIRPLTILLGAEGEMIEYCVSYGRFLLIAIVPFMLQNVFQSFMITAEKPQFGLGITIAAGLTNMVLDALFVAVFKWGLTGAALATDISQFVGGFIPLIYFFVSKKNILKIGKAKTDLNALLKTCTNGSSEFLSNISLSLVNMLYNFQLMKFAGEDGVAAYGVIMYVNFIFIGTFMGYSFGVSPVISFHYGAGHEDELKSLYKKSITIISLMALLLTGLAELMAPILSGVFVSYDARLYALTTRGFRIYSASFLIMGFNIFASSFFTALNDGFVSAVISFMRTLVFQIIAILILPALFGTDGIWSAIVIAELAALMITALFMAGKREKYKYI